MRGRGAVLVWGTERRFRPRAGVDGTQERGGGGGPPPPGGGGGGGGKKNRARPNKKGG